MLSLVAARRLSENVSLGLRFNYHTLKIAGYGRAMAITADAGVLFHLSPVIHFGIQLNNPGGSSAEPALPVPPVYIAGLGYEPSGNLFFSAEVVRQGSHPPDGRLGIQYLMNSSILLRLIIQTGDPSFCFGAGFQQGSFRLDVYSNYHLRLGPGMGVVLHYRFKKKEEASMGD